MTPLYFQIEILQKIVGTNSPPGGPRGVRPQNFWKSLCIPPRVMCMQSFIHISLKLWSVDVGENRGTEKKKKKQKKQTPFAMSGQNRKSDRSDPYTIG